MNFNEETLKKFGLNDNEIKVYLASLKEENLTPFKIAKITNIPRTTVYDTLMGLSLKGLVELEQSDGFTKQQTLVKAKNPSVLREIIRKKRSDLSALEVDIVEILPDLKKEFQKDKANANFQFFPGLEGAKKVYFDLEFTKLNIPTYTWDIQMPMDAFGLKQTNDLVNELNAIRKTHKYIDKELMPLNDWGKHVLSYQVERDPDYLTKTEIRYIENSSFQIFNQVEIKGDRVNIVSAWNDELWGMKIKSKVFAETMKSVFLMNWSIATPITRDMVASWGPNEFLKEQKKKKTK